MQTFCFSKEARLYARNKPIVEAMEKAMEENIEAFIKCLCVEVQQQVKPMELLDQVMNKKWQVFQLNKKTMPWIAFDKSLHTIVDPGEILFCMAGPGESSDVDRHKALKLVQDPTIKGWGFTPAKGYWWLTGKVSYKGGNPVETVAPILIALLLKIDKVFKESEKADAADKHESTSV